MNSVSTCFNHGRARGSRGGGGDYTWCSMPFVRTWLMVQIQSKGPSSLYASARQVAGDVKQEKLHGIMGGFQKEVILTMDGLELKI